jgi:hypothetical protein
MIVYSMNDTPEFLYEFWEFKNNREVGDKPRTYRDWLKPQGATVSMRNAPDLATDVILEFANPLDELVFRLRWKV